MARRVPTHVTASQRISGCHAPIFTLRDHPCQHAVAYHDISALRAMVFDWTIAWGSTTHSTS